ncbi:YafY family transcriptional regulator [Paenibacillus albiflavus]|uniref:YafY family transcriptional regulator n=1 Tax=Paenibacillus albiflavus TaxID=2545760 RepID=A0A4R4EJ93_9BACL|nr:YafY family transcriptional regulator [Paenibacillus albiflavus]
MNERRLAIIQVLDARKKFTARELAERFDVSIRTIQRDLDYLQQIGFPLYTELGPHGGYRVLPNRLLPPLQLTQTEAFGLFLMIKWLEQVHDFPYDQIRSHLAEQYYAELPTDIKESIDRMRDHIAFYQHTNQVASPFTTTVLEAAMDKREISFIYHSSGGDKPFQVFPFGIYYENGKWYMPALYRDRVTLFRVDRMKEVLITEQSDPSIPTLKEWLNAKDERESVNVVLHFTEFGMRLAGSDKLFGSLISNEWSGSVPIDELPYVARLLFKYGPEVKVIEPVQLQKLVIQMLERSLSQYRE